MERKRLQNQSHQQVTTSTSIDAKPDFKFIHFADTHLGLNWPAIGRLEHIQIPVYGQAFASIIEAALTQRADFVIHGGDLVDRPRPPTAAWNRILQELPKLKNSGIPFLVVPGSHDKPESYFDKAGGDVLTVLDKRLGLVKRLDSDTEPFKYETKSGKKIIIYGLGDHGINQETELLKLKRTMREGPEFKILIIHGTISGTPNQVGPTVKTETINELLSQRLVDYVAQGHNHKRWEHGQMHIYNPGSPEITSFADAPTIKYNFTDDGHIIEDARENIQHGYYSVQVSGEIINANFITRQARDVRNIRIEFQNAKANQVTEAAKQAIMKNSSEHSILRPVFSGTLHPSSSRTEIDLREILSMREKMLYLDYPLMNFEQKTNITFNAKTDLNSILEQYFTSTLGPAARETTEIAMNLLRAYERRTKASHQEALEIIDQWKPKE